MTEAWDCNAQNARLFQDTTCVMFYHWIKQVMWWSLLSKGQIEQWQDWNSFYKPADLHAMAQRRSKPSQECPMWKLSNQHIGQPMFPTSSCLPAWPTSILSAQQKLRKGVGEGSCDLFGSPSSVFSLTVTWTGPCTLPFLLRFPPVGRGSNANTCPKSFPCLVLFSLVWFYSRRTYWTQDTWLSSSMVPSSQAP